MKDIREDDSPLPNQTTRRPEPMPVRGTIIGVPWNEARAWLQTWGRGRKVAPPKPRPITDQSRG